MQYVRTGAVTRDLIFTDIGVLEVATEGIPLGMSTSVIIGELWVTYSVKLSRAELYNSLLGSAINQDVLFGTTSAAQLISSTTLVKSTNSIGVTAVNVSATQMTVLFPVNISLGSFQIYMFFQNGVTPFTTQVVQTFSTYANCTSWVPGAFLPGTTGAGLTAPTGLAGATADNAISGITWVTVNSPGLLQASINISISAALPGGTLWKLYVTQSNQLASLSLT